MAALRVNAAVIGLGIGERHIEHYEADPRCRVAVLCDIDPVKLADVGARHPGRQLTTDPAAVFADPAIDVVSIASYDDAHAGQVVAAIRAGKDVFVEKPLCLLDEEFAAIDRALLAHPRVRLSSNLILRGAPQFRELKRRIDAGTLGRLYYLEGDYNYGRLEKITDGWRGGLDFYSVTHGGAIHLLDLMLWLSGHRVVDVVAVGNRIATAGTRFRFADMVTALLRFDDGMTAKVSANFGCVAPHHHVLSVYGTAGTFLNGRQGGVFYSSRDPGAASEALQLPYLASAKGEVQRSFVQHLLDGTPAIVDLAAVMNAMATSLAIERSLRSGAWEAVRPAESSLAPRR
jgi:predicted dehydrogenase